MFILSVLQGEIIAPPPIWLMRQAGRYLPEYLDLRKTSPDFLSLCLNPDKASQVTLQPIQRFGFDAAIIFSDILLIPWALDRGLHFIAGEGPRLDPLPDYTPLKHFETVSLTPKFHALAQAIKKTKTALPRHTPLIGFSGAPWTLATYMIEGGTSRDFAASINWLWQHPANMHQLIDLLTHHITDFLSLQAEAGADILMLFDSWAGALPASHRQNIIIDSHKAIIAGLRRRGHTQPLIAFPKNLGEGLITYAEQTDISALALDHRTDPHWAAKTLPQHLPLQGNLDPACLVAGGDLMYAEIDNILTAFSDRPHIFNLGHGILPSTPPAHVTALINYLRQNT